jgi:putative ABC transport system permease protein
VQTYGMEVIAGRDFSRGFASDSTAAFLINEAAVASLGWASPEEALGKRVQQWGRDGEIVGVVRDFHYQSLHQAIEPLILHIRPEEFRFLSLRVQADQIHATLAALEERWQQLVPGRPFEYAFLDERFQQQYQADVRFGKLFGYFAGLAILIACLGLFGLAAFTATQRTKEVGVRKVLGASAGQILLLLSRDFTKPVLWAFVLGAPVAYLAMQHWLGSFAYHVSISPWLLLLVGGVVMAIAWLSVGYQSIKAALTDPVKSLRYE